MKSGGSNVVGQRKQSHGTMLQNKQQSAVFIIGDQGILGRTEPRKPDVSRSYLS